MVGEFLGSLFPLTFGYFLFSENKYIRFNQIVSISVSNIEPKNNIQQGNPLISAYIEIPKTLLPRVFCGSSQSQLWEGAQIFLGSTTPYSEVVFQSALSPPHQLNCFCISFLRSQGQYINYDKNKCCNRFPIMK